jgi:uncharacterized membrane protein (UPF0127 family)
MKNNIIYFIIVIIFVVLLFFIPQKYNLTDIKGIKIAGQTLKADLALTEAEQTQGLSGRGGLNADEVMIFIFDHPGHYPFWMKDMNFSIDMIWLDSSMRVVYIKENATPESYPLTFGPQTTPDNSKYVLEVVSGFSAKNNLKVGDKVEFIY